jgi:hypothetical protein
MYLDPVTGEWRLLARFRAGQRCRCCKSYLSAGSFGLSRIVKRDYECRRCHAIRCSRERIHGRRGKRAARIAAVNPQPQEVRP